MKKKEISLFSAETLDSLAMAEIMGGECNNCHGGNCGNCVTQCSCSAKEKGVCGDIEVHTGAICGVKIGSCLSQLTDALSGGPAIL